MDEKLLKFIKDWVDELEYQRQMAQDWYGEGVAKKYDLRIKILNKFVELKEKED